MSVVVVVDAAVAGTLDLPPCVHVVPREAPRWGRDRRARSLRPLYPDRVLELLCELPRPALVLARPDASDPDAACLAALARLAGHQVVRLPARLDEAVWSVGAGFAVEDLSDRDRNRVLDVVCCGPDAAPAMPRQAWGPGGLTVPAVRPATLARWACCAWRPCGWCDAGGLSGHRCRRCGYPIAEVAWEAAA